MARIAAPGGIKKHLPILAWLPHDQAAWLRIDLVARLSAAAVFLPQAPAYATIVGLPVQVGLYRGYHLTEIRPITGKDEKVREPCRLCAIRALCSK